MNLQQFKEKYLGKQVEYHSYGGEGTYNQCVDLVNQYITEVLKKTPIIGTHAKDFEDKYNHDEFDWIPNTPDGIPQPGDIIVWNGRVGGGAGHVAIALDNLTVNSFTSLDQNWSQKERVTIENHNYTNVSGWLHPKENMANELETCMKDRQKFWDERDDLLRTIGAASVEEGKSMVAGYKSRITDLSNQLGSARAEAENQKEKASRMEAQLIAEMDKVKSLDERLNNKQIELDNLAREKGLQAIELAQAKEQIETLKQQQAQGEVTLTIKELFSLIWNHKITIKK